MIQIFSLVCVAAYNHPCSKPPDNCFYDVLFGTIVARSHKESPEVGFKIRLQNPAAWVLQASKQRLTAAFL